MNDLLNSVPDDDCLFALEDLFVRWQSLVEFEIFGNVIPVKPAMGIDMISIHMMCVML